MARKKKTFYKKEKKKDGLKKTGEGMEKPERTVDPKIREIMLDGP